MNFANAVDIAVHALTSYEGFIPVAKYDVNGYAIGYGNHYYQDGSNVQKGDTITRAAALTLLTDITAQKERAIRNYVTAALSDSQYAMLISLAYNCGEGNLRTSKVLQLINSGADDNTIYSQWIKTCITSKGVYNPDLEQRRKTEWLELWNQPHSVSIADILLIAFASWGIYHLVKDSFSDKRNIRVYAPGR